MTWERSPQEAAALEQEELEARRVRDRRRNRRRREATQTIKEQERVEAAKRRRVSPSVAAEAKQYFGEAIYEGLPEPPNTKIGRQWKPGQSGNLAGKPKQPQGLTDILAWVLSRKNRKALADNLVKMALGQGSVALQATQYIFDRLEGKPRQAIIEQRDKQDPLIELITRILDDPQASPSIGEVVTVVPILREPISSAGSDTSVEAEVREIAG